MTGIGPSPKSDSRFSPFTVRSRCRRARVGPFGRQGILDRCIALGLPYRSSKDDRRLFDPVEVRNFIKYAHLVERAHLAQQNRSNPSTIDGAAHLEPVEINRLRGKNCPQIQLDRASGRRVVRLALPLPIEDLTTAPNLSSFLPLMQMMCRRTSTRRDSMFDFLSQSPRAQK